MKRVINFLKLRYVAFVFSAVLFIVFVAGTIMRGGMNMGIDFTGGVRIIAQFSDDLNEKDIRDAFTAVGVTPQVQQIGDEKLNEFSISTKLSGGANESDKGLQEIKDILLQKFPSVTFLSEENIGPTIGDILKRSAIKLFIIAMVFMSVYLAFRFELKYAFGAMVSIIHDTAMCAAFIGFTGTEVTIPVVAAVITVFGYSVNDTIVIFDRIRENMKSQSKQTFVEIINKSISLSMSRTLLTSLTTLFTVLSLFFLGGEVIHDFAKVLLFGIIIGTYSSIYLASPMLVIWENLRSKNKQRQA